MRKKRLLFIAIILFAIVCCGGNVGNKMVYATEGIPFGSITIDNPTAEPVIQYDVLTEVKKGDTIAFNIDFNSSDKVSINILADGLIKCYEQEYEIWEGKNTLAYESDRDMRYFTIYVKYHGQKLAERVCEINNIRLKQNNQTGETVVHVGTEEEHADAGNTKHVASGHVIAGLVLTVVAVVMAVVCVIVLLIKRKEKKKRASLSRM